MGKVRESVDAFIGTVVLIGAIAGALWLYWRVVESNLPW